MLPLKVLLLALVLCVGCTPSPNNSTPASTRDYAHLIAVAAAESNATTVITPEEKPDSEKKHPRAECPNGGWISPDGGGSRIPCPDCISVSPPEKKPAKAVACDCWRTGICTCGNNCQCKPDAQKSQYPEGYSYQSTDGYTYKFTQGQWIKCNATSCQPVPYSKTPLAQPRRRILGRW